MFRGYYPDWVWNGPEIPPTKPAYSNLLPDQSGRVWVIRSGRGSYNPLCDDPEPPRGTECWIEEAIIDVFGSDGRYLGSVELPENLDLRPVPFIRDDLVIGVVEDEAGTIMVKRYRLVLPREGGGQVTSHPYRCLALVMVVLTGYAIGPAEDRDVRGIDVPKPTVVISSESILLELVVDMTLDSEGNLLLLDWTRAAVVVVPADGGEPKILGRKGQGPGEFLYPSNVGVSPGSIKVLD